MPEYWKLGEACALAPITMAVRIMLSADHLRVGGAAAKAIAAKLAPRSGLRPIDLDSYSRLSTNSGLMP